ncbi:hypothetical protein [Haliangium ochraceum]|uniref:Lipoprotein n=1 Tax=Haliangium ochraceum (strain DSM 14365 / JCM 11303 / SMP-2) TaxID=502025 RepID=D0LUI0_HALO1|nr:hypothetical protein [Haliangium ochraceum]ACY19303.1 hypothetical protein Hoch_6839 [Haliangium ochraceum DSM 14365]
MKTFRTLSTPFASLFLGLAITATGCASQESAEMSAEDYDDVAMGVGSLVATSSGGGETGSLEDALVVALEGSSESDDDSAEGSIEVEVIVRAGLIYEYDLSCFDLAGAPLADCGAETDTAEVALSWSGEIVAPRYEASIDRVGEWQLSGLQSGTAVFSGTGSFEVSSSFQALGRDVSRDLALSYDASYQDIAIDMETRRALSGSIVYQISGERSGERPQGNLAANFSVRAELSFLGDGTASLLLDGSHAYSIDLSSGALSAAN